MTGGGESWRMPTPDPMTRLVRMRILLVEDDADTAAYVVDGLKADGHTADHAPDGRDGLILATGRGLTTLSSSIACSPGSTGSSS